MKRHHVPVRADHDLLTPNTQQHTLLGVRLHSIVQVRSEVVASSSGHLNDSSSNQSAARSLRRCTQSPARHLRFEDETEKEAESRYLERQRRRAGQRDTGVLVSKPDLNLYVNGQMGTGRQRTQRISHVVDRLQRGWTMVGEADHCDSYPTVLGRGVNLNLNLYPPVPEDRGRSLYRPRLSLRTEPIRETYIGSAIAGETSGGGCGIRHVAPNQVKRRTNQAELNENQMTVLQDMAATDLPINPYAPNQLTIPTQVSHLALSTKCQTSLTPPLVTAMMSQSTKAGKNLNQKQEEPGRPATAEKEKSPCVDVDLKLNMKNSSSSSSETTAKSRSSPTSDCSSDGQMKQSMRAELHCDDTSLPDVIRRNESPHRSLRRLFSGVKLSKNRTSSLDRHSSGPCPSDSDLESSCSRMSSGELKKTSCVHLLSAGSPLFQLRKSSSVQNILEQKKDRSADYRPTADQSLQRCLTLKDVGCPCSVRSVGRVLHVCSDGTFLLEISRPKNRKFGFIVSRGRGRPDSGVYVEDMVDSSTEKLYAGLLAVGDEILEVNGEKVACLSVDQVTHLLTQNSSATIRVLRPLRTR
ncbi:hypothetical protein GBF38_018307 [Nibea albiflora]|uniref:Uncharacterized protein n=1 Tax=Nibea albiflora TaxID=240163 RepID=A0ACB7EMP9_NIBAL|nr:hypothetical protein GBF38_018307 [Nibea albiflora]